LAIVYLVGGFNHLEKYESQWEGLSRYPINEMESNKSHVPNHQPDIVSSAVFFPHLPGEGC